MSNRMTDGRSSTLATLELALSEACTDVIPVGLKWEVCKQPAPALGSGKVRVVILEGCEVKDLGTMERFFWDRREFGSHEEVAWRITSRIMVTVFSLLAFGLGWSLHGVLS